MAEIKLISDADAAKIASNLTIAFYSHYQGKETDPNITREDVLKTYEAFKELIEDKK